MPGEEYFRAGRRVPINRVVVTGHRHGDSQPTPSPVQVSDGYGDLQVPTGEISDGFGDTNRYDPPTRERQQLADGTIAYLGDIATN